MISCRAACLPKGPPNRVGWDMQGGCIIQGWVGHARVGVVGHVEVQWVM